MDTHYFERGSRTALLLFRQWTDAVAQRTYVSECQSESAEYVPGEFYLRELPCITAAIRSVESEIDAIVIDGYVQLGHGRSGLGKKLFEQLQRRIPVVGVAKSPFLGANEAIRLNRGQSKTPLYVTAIGISVADAVHFIDQMHGTFRIPTLLKQVDKIARGTS